MGSSDKKKFPSIARRNSNNQKNTLGLLCSSWSLKAVMERSVRVHDLTPKCCAERRLSVVSELCPASEAISDGNTGFLPDAVAPRGEWRTPTCDELSRLIGSPGVHEYPEVLIAPMPRLSRVLAAHLASRRKADLTFLPEAVRESIDDIASFCDRLDGLICQGAWVGPGGLRLVTHNPDPVAPLRIGLHIDNWDELPLLERSRARRRLCINIGSGPRYLVFLPTPISALVAAGKLSGELPENMAAPAVIRAYLNRNLNQPAVRVRIDPGEAYVVNADDVIHDGASGSPDVPDAALHFLGHFRPPNRRPDCAGDGARDEDYRAITKPDFSA
jgi:hypothetical protein